MTIGHAERIVPIDPEELFKALGEARIDYILIGGLATAAHGVIRATKDMDICPNPSEQNLRRLADLLERLDAEILEVADFETDELISPDLEGLMAGGNFCLATSLGRLDVMQYLEPFEEDSWEALVRSAEMRALYGYKFRVCSFEALVTMKEAADRDQDRLDVKSLKAARGDL